MKHKMWSRLLSMALAVMMISSIVPNSAFAEAASEITNSTSQVQVEETPVVENDVPQDEVTVPEEETPVESVEPTAEPTADPTAEPTAEPTQAPEATTVPSEQPSTEPTATPEATEAPNASAQPSESPAPSATPAPSASPLPSETPVPTETPAATEEPAIDGQALLDELMAIEDDEAFMKAVNELTEEQIAALEALGKDALADYTLRVESLTAPEETVELNAEAKEFTTVVEGVDGVTVTVKVPEGALPVDAELKASMIDQSSEEYAKAEEALADENLNEQPAEYDGMIALDIRFEVGGQEVEPLKEVEVSIDAQALLPEDADPETVAVQHLKEDATGEVVNVETVADVTEETGEVTVEVAPAEEVALNVASTFAVDGFSTFTITWEGKSLSVYIVDQDGTLIYDEEIVYQWSHNNDAISIDKLLQEAEIPQKFEEDGVEYIFHRGAANSLDGETISQFAYNFSASDWKTRWHYNSGDFWWKQLNEIYLVFTGRSKVETESTKGLIDVDLFNYSAEINNGQRALTFYNWANAKDGKGSEDWLTFDNGKEYTKTDLRQGLVQNTLQNGYPVTTAGRDGNRSLDYLFGGTKNDAVISYKDTDGLFQYDASTGYYTYNSKENAVDFNTETKEFTVWNYTEHFKSGNNAPSSGDFLPFNDLADALGDYYSYRDGKVYYLGDKDGSNAMYKWMDYWFGVKMSLEFNQPKDGLINGQKMEFTFTGDDDVWVFVDGVLVLDIGGIHGAITGTIDFSTGNVTVDGADDTTLKQLFENAGKADEVSWKGDTFEDFSSGHRLDYFYLERGGGESNCNMKFNIQPVPPASINVEKELDAENAEYAKNVEYKFQLLVENDDGVLVPYKGNYKIDDATTIYTTNDGNFTLRDGQKAVFYTDINMDTRYQVKELGVVNDYDVEITINDRTVTTTSEGNNVSTGTVALKEYVDADESVNNVLVKNKARNGVTWPSLIVEKKMAEGQNNPDTTFAMQVTIGETIYTGEYYVTDQKATSYTGVQAQKATGGKLKVKAGQKIWIPNLVPGSTYFVEEVDLDENAYKTPVYASQNGTIKEDTTVTVTNEAKNGQLTFTKTLEGLCDGDTMALFTVEIKDGDGNSYYKTLKFKEKGNQSFTITLPVGSYQIRELSNLGYTNGTIQEKGAALTAKDGYYTFEIKPGDETNLTVTNTANNNNSSKIDKDTAVNRFTKDNDGWTWKRQ